MRLIDAVALIHTHESEVAIIGKDWTVGDLAAAIKTAPTIDAIPVEWIRKYTAVGIAPNGRRLTEGKERIVINRMLNEWQKEQEEEK